MTQESTDTGRFTRLLQGLAVGAAAMYLLDPDKGRRRRASLRDQFNRLAADIGDLAHDATRDSANRLQGLRARVDRRMSGDTVDELRLIERVRAALGRVMSHPHAIQVGAMQGTVRLSGPVLAQEVPALLASARTVPGVVGVENLLDVHDRADIPALQGQSRRRRGRDFPAPALRMGTLLGGGVLALWALRKDGVTRLGLAGIAYALAKRALYGSASGVSDDRTRPSARRRDIDDRHLPTVVHAGRPTRNNGASTGAAAEGGDLASSSRPPATH